MTDEVIEDVSPPDLGQILGQDVGDILPQDLVLTDTANGQIFVDMHGKYVRYAIDTRRWYVWSGDQWVEDTQEHLKALVLATDTAKRRRNMVLQYPREDPAEQNKLLNQATQLQNMAKLKTMLTAASCDPRLQVNVRDFDSNRNVINAINGAVDLTTGELTNTRSQDMHSYCCSVPYVREAAKAGYSSLLEEYLETFLPDEVDQRFIFATLGQSLFMENSRRMLPIFWGETTSGKSQLMAAVHNILGGYICTINASVFRGQQDDKPRPDLVAAMYKRIAWASEASKSWSLHADQVKRLTGNEPIPYRNHYEGIVNEMPRFTPIIVTNAIPHIVGLDPATKRRIYVVHFDKSLEKAKEDPKKRDVFLKDERCLQALLARMVYGARDPIIEIMPAKYMLATMNAHGEMDSVDEFLTWATGEEMLLEIPRDSARLGMIKANDMHKLYIFWIKNYAETGLKKDHLSLRELGSALRERGWASAVSGGTRWLGWKLGDSAPTSIKWNLPT